MTYGWKGKQHDRDVLVLDLHRLWPDDSEHMRGYRDADVVWEEAGMSDAPKDKRPPVLTKEQARQSGYTGDVCPSCFGIKMRRNGSCLICDDCHTTTGCS